MPMPRPRDFRAPSDQTTSFCSISQFAGARKFGWNYWIMAECYQWISNLCSSPNIILAKYVHMYMHVHINHIYILQTPLQTLTVFWQVMPRRNTTMLSKINWKCTIKMQVLENMEKQKVNRKCRTNSHEIELQMSILYHFPLVNSHIHCVPEKNVLSNFLR